MVRIDTVKGSILNNGGSKKANKRMSNAWWTEAPWDGLQIGAMGQVNQGGGAIDSRSTTQVTEWRSGRFSSQRMDKSPKAREDNELGLGEDSFKTYKCMAQTKPRRHTNKFSTVGFFSIVSKI